MRKVSALSSSRHGRDAVCLPAILRAIVMGPGANAGSSARKACRIPIVRAIPRRSLLPGC
jgi:hypothetical protein